MAEKTASSWAAWVFTGLVSVFAPACVGTESTPAATTAPAIPAAGRPLSIFDQAALNAPVPPVVKSPYPGIIIGLRPQRGAAAANLPRRLYNENGSPVVRRYNPYMNETAEERARRRRMGGAAAHESARRRAPGPRPHR